MNMAITRLSWLRVFCFLLAARVGLASSASLCDRIAQERDGLQYYGTAVSAGELERDQLLVVDLVLSGQEETLIRAFGNSPISRFSEAFLVAVTQGKISIVNMFINRGFNPDTKLGESGATAIVIAAQCSRNELMGLLISKGADINARTTDELDALLISVFEDNLEGVRMLLSAGFNIHASRSKNGLSPVDLARQLGHLEILAELEKDRNQKPTKK